LSMQKRRLAETKMKRISVDPISGGKIIVPSEHWDNLQKKDPNEVCRIALAQLESSGDIRLRVLNTDLFINIQERAIRIKFQGQLNPVENPLLELIVVIYLLHITSAPLRHEIVGVKDLKSAHFFQGPHELDTESLLERFGRNLNEFKKVAKNLGGRVVTQADTGYVFSPLPKILLYYLLWEGDEEFEPRLSILFDRSIEDHFTADFIWALVRYVSGALLSY
jgi:hypothetical protein